MSGPSWVTCTGEAKPHSSMAQPPDRSRERHKTRSIGVRVRATGTPRCAGYPRAIRRLIRQDRRETTDAIILTIGIEDLGLAAFGQRLLDRLQAEVHLHGDRHPP